MKRRNAIAALGAAALITLTLAGCGQPSSQAEYIGIDAAKAIALEAAGVSESTASFSTAGLDKQNGMDYYAVDFDADGQSYEYDIDAVTGVIISSSAPASGVAAAPAPSAAAGTETSAAPSTVPSTTPATGGQTTGTTPSTGNTQAAAGTGITEDRAREIALEHAGLSADQVTFIKSKLDYEDWRRVYEVEFYTSDYREYDYEIDADTGEIRSYDYDAEGYAPPASGTTTITADQAKEIALAKVPGATANDIYEFELDRDDGRLEYEGSIYYSGTEYEFTIDGYSGAIRSWEVEPYGF